MTPSRRRLLLCFAAMASLAGAAVAEAARRPNLLLLSIDTLRADHVSCYGYPRPTTPSLDLLARNGLRLDRARAVAPWTLPSFASMLTGLYPTRHGAGATGPVRNLSEQTPTVMAPGIVTLAQALRDAGYRTGAVTSNPYLRLGPLRGFEDALCKAVRADRIGALARAWLRRHRRDRPWALWVHFNDPHEPTLAADAQLHALGVDDSLIQHPERRALQRWGDESRGSYLGRRTSEEDAAELLDVKIALYDATIRQVDAEIGRILEQLQRSDQLRDTLVVVVSDHGEEFLDHVEEGRHLAHDPRGVWGIGHGHTFYEELLRVPWILMGPGVPAGRVIEEDVSLLDFMPTVLGLLGVAAPEGLDGRDRRAWIADHQRRPLAHAAENLAYGPDWIAWVDGRHELVTDRSGEVQLLYDLERDPYQLHDLAAGVDTLAFAADLRDSLAAWNTRMRDRAPAGSTEGDLDPEMLKGLKSLGYVK